MQWYGKVRYGQARDSRFWKRILRVYGLKLGPWRASQPEAPGQKSTCFCGTGAQGHGGAETGTQTTGDRPPGSVRRGEHRGPAQDEEGNSRGLNTCCRASPGSAAEASSLDLGPKENYVDFPLSHHESAGSDKHVSSARAFRGHMVTAFFVQNGPSDSIKTSQPMGGTVRIRTHVFGCSSSVLFSLAHLHWCPLSRKTLFWKPPTLNLWPHLD